MGLKKLILAISGLGVLAMLFTSINYYIEKNKHNHPVSRQTIQMTQSEEKNTFKPNEQLAKAPNIGQNTTLPENIPPAMLEALAKQGMSMEDLQNNGMTTIMGKGNSPANNMQENNGTADFTMPSQKEMEAMKGMQSNKKFPEEMLKAIQEQNKMLGKQNGSKQTQNNMTIDAMPMDESINKAIDHIKSHANKEEMQAIQESIARINADPSQVDAIISLAETFLNHNETKATEKILQIGIIATPTNAVLPYLYGHALSKASEFEKAAEQWERALSLQDSAEVHYSLGMLYRYKLKNDEKAKQHFQKANELPAHDPALADQLKHELAN